MYTRILVPLDGSALAEAVVNTAFECAFLKPSVVSSLVDGLEAEPSLTGCNVKAVRHSPCQANVQQQKLHWRLQTR